MKFTFTCKNVDHDSTWKEWLEEDGVNTQEEAERYVKKLIAWFNDTARPGDSVREVVSVVADMATAGAQMKHTWQKTNLITIMASGGGSYDTVECAHCGVTGRRYGLGSKRIYRDRKFKKEVYERCDTAFAKTHPDDTAPWVRSTKRYRLRKKRAK